MVLARCEWGHDDYSLNVANLPMAQPSPAIRSMDGKKGSRARIAVNAAQDGLFDSGDGSDV